MNIIHFACLSFKSSNGIKTVLTELIPQQISLGHSVIFFNLIENKQKIFENEIYVSSYNDFVSQIKKNTPTIVVFHGGYELKYYMFAHHLRNKRIPYIFVPHGGTSKQNLQKKRILKIIVNTLFTKRFIKRAAGVFFLNENEKDGSVFANVIRRYAIIPNGIGSHNQNIIKPSTPKVHFIYISRIDFENKRPDVLLKAVEQFYEDNPEIDFDFHFYGGRYDPSIVETFQNMIKAAKGPVYYHGEVLGEDKEKAYKEGNIYVLTSLYEGMPLTVLEALSYGNPCIISPQTNMADLIKNTHSGWITNPDENSIAKTLLIAYNDYTANRSEYIQNAFEAVKAYSWDKIAERSIKEYSRLINSF